ncbi:acyl-ACP--UDP-N-acetylglucosamine O-acyltransferase [Methylococcus sp. EFPC2]|uniref:acyl-ACP--UDP-N-acetylglucosamine O-acyltransferase n=1 Tax=Methylococcus sp. EFPC2 TaxID=2812648 RepID=UPI0019682AA5|nr:acyl-ACP--UDP-N-acetylglucosamine O-acyltransferase [Methylococcus sp. EFPC2]QSA97154.1 acyl-ACP--UDP-N-acetylglucosamine O-acyltransferase [Methylococcus sp. EFPC2]
MTGTIHPTAHIAPGAKLGAGVTVGPYAVIEDQVEIGDGSVIGAHAIIQPRVRMGRNNTVHPTAVLGGLPQDLAFDPQFDTWVEIGDGNVLREGVTISRATKTGTATRIGNECYLMNNSHVGHDCTVGNNTIFASGATLGGHAQVGDRVFLGGGVMTHQFCRIGSYAMLQGLAGINKDVLPFMMVGGRPGKHYRLNLVGLRRAGIDGERLKTVSAAIRRLRNKQSLEGLADTPELDYLRAWLAEGSKRGILPFIDIHKDAD